MTEAKHNPSLYRELNAGFSSIEVASKATDAFWEEFYELRIKHRIPDALVTVRLPLEDGGEAYVTMHAGNELYAEPMAAYAFGQESVRRQERIGDLTAKYLKNHRKK